LLVALSCSSSRATTARLIGDVRVSVLKTFHPSSDSAGTMQASPYTPRSRSIDDSCRVTLCHKKFNNSTQTKRLCR
jgi:hypothetical protein